MLNNQESGTILKEPIDKTKIVSAADLVDIQNVKVCFISQQGGHYAQLNAMKPIMSECKQFIVTEAVSEKRKDIPGKLYYLSQVNRREKQFLLRMMINTLKQLIILLKERPKVIITTGVLCVIPMCLMGKYLFGQKLIYIEQFAKTKQANKTGRLLYKHADFFFVQWETMLSVYPNAVYMGGIYG